MKKYINWFLEEMKDILKIVIAGLVVGGLISDQTIHDRPTAITIFISLFVLIISITFYLKSTQK